jgi:small multidrug resistance family-3 protein
LPQQPPKLLFLQICSFIDYCFQSVDSAFDKRLIVSTIKNYRESQMLEIILGFARAFGLFVIAALFEIAGAYLIWQWQRAEKSVVVALFGLAALFIYSVIQTTQTFGFGRTFAAYGGIFILVAMLWGWLIDKQIPDTWDVLGAALCLIGALIIVAAPRS